MPTQFGYISTALGATETTETSLGNIKVPPHASMITGVSAAVVLQTGTAAEGCLGHCRLSYAKAGELKGIPTAIVVSEELGGSYTPAFTPIRVNVEALTDIACFATLTLAQTGTAHCVIHLRFE